LAPVVSMVSIQH